MGLFLSFLGSREAKTGLFLMPNSETGGREGASFSCPTVKRVVERVPPFLPNSETGGGEGSFFLPNSETGVEREALGHTQQ